ncbi:thioesterase II family protein [Streptomyces rubradiris]|uniref:Thioesterase n=1 Tax=Streptomyces rubradiris TaxID=285531 RepID=A0ABQ3RQY5_STRRR|nr:alpha/beta fold hydrolase [Streptomyces rubradiris]GHH24575.1 thioesterase [Streptomyces rubradiris]GHI58291.1 thioesterase [Streptomyces rubradiris]
MRNPWFALEEPRDEAGVRLFCLPYAGGAAAAYRTWRELAPGHVRVHPLELPGRGARWGETPVNRMPLMTELLADALAEHLERPYALFGHSMGGLIAFELARTLRARGLPQPAHLFVSGSAAPDLPRTRKPIHAAPDADVLEELRFLGGTPAELLDDPGLMELVLPALRADFALLETYRYQPQPPLTVPLTVFGGESDPLVASDQLHRWLRQSDAGPRLVVLPGEHFFLHSSVADVLGTIADALAAVGPEALPPASQGVV